MLHGLDAGEEGGVVGGVRDVGKHRAIVLMRIHKFCLGNSHRLICLYLEC